jgi:putative ABC transport system substrate-binding protein
LRELDYVEGQTITIEYRYTDTEIERAPELAAELVKLGMDVIVATGGEAAAIASNATASIPIVGTILGPDPVGAGLVASFARPGGNVTGLRPAPPSGLGGKRLK